MSGTPLITGGGRRSRWLGATACGAVIGLTLVYTSLGAAAATQPSLGTTPTYAILAGTTVTNAGQTVVNGDLGLSTGSAVTNFPPGILVGAYHIDDTAAVTAKSDLDNAFTTTAGQPCDQTLNGDLGNRTLVPGVYCYTSDTVLTGTITLNNSGDPNAVFIFKIASALTAMSNSSVSMTNGGGCGVFWIVGSSATIGTYSTFVGTVMAYDSIAMQTGASMLPGRALARTGAVTLDTNNITRPPGPCTAAAGGGTGSPTPTASSPGSPGPGASPTPTITAAIVPPGSPSPGGPPIVAGPGGPGGPGGPPSSGPPTPGLPHLPRAGALFHDVVIAAGSRLVQAPLIALAFAAAVAMAFGGSLIVRRRRANGVGGSVYAGAASE